MKSCFWPRREHLFNKKKKKETEKEFELKKENMHFVHRPPSRPLGTTTTTNNNNNNNNNHHNNHHHHHHHIRNNNNNNNNRAAALMCSSALRYRGTSGTSLLYCCMCSYVFCLCYRLISLVVVYLLFVLLFAWGGRRARPPAGRGARSPCNPG